MKEIVCVMAIHRRAEITRETIRLLQKQTYPLKDILLVGDSELERQLARETGCSYRQTWNRPLGNKWQSGIRFARSRHPDAVLINGSDNWLTVNWVERMAEYLEKGYELVGKNVWYVCRLENGKPIELIKRSYDERRRGISMGAGRLISSSILDRLRWKLYPRFINSSLDTKSHERMLGKGARSIVVNPVEDANILDLKGPWECINTWETIKNAPILVRHPDIADPRGWLRDNFPEAIQSIQTVATGVLLN